MTYARNGKVWRFTGGRALACACAMAAAAALTGCMPGGDDDDNSSQSAAQKFAGPDAGRTQVSRSAKKDALLNINPVEQIGRGIDETVQTVKRAGQQLASVNPVATQHANVAVSLLPDAAPVSIEAGLADFYAALKGLETRKRAKPVTVVHLGDANVAGDQFTGDIRTQLQGRFGQAGRGLMQPAVYPAQGIKFDRGGQWRTVSSIETEGFFGISGVKIVASTPDAWLRLTALEAPFDWAEVTLETGPSFGTAIISVDGEQRQVTTASAKQELTTVRFAKPGRELMVKAKGDSEVRVHSWSAGNNRPGVNYVNLGLAKATALTPERWNPAAVEADLKRLAPSLIVLGFGTNEGFDDKFDAATYEQHLLQVIARLKTAAPEASFIIVGPPDAARMPAFAANLGSGSDTCRPLTAQEITSYERWMRKDDPRLARWFSPPKLQDARASLRRVAANVNAYFWDWSKLMGGPCGIHAWVHAEPPLAAANHVQLTAEGAKRSARSFTAEIMSGYTAYSTAARR
jgi:lysophospholipase L1-like esterase